MKILQMKKSDFSYLFWIFFAGLRFFCRLLNLDWSLNIHKVQINSLDFYFVVCLKKMNPERILIWIQSYFRKQTNKMIANAQQGAP